MKHIFLLSIVLLALSFQLSVGESIFDLWESWKSEHGKSYESEIEHLARLGVWLENHLYIQKHNSEADQGLHNFTLGHNFFSDFNITEFSQLFKGFKRSNDSSDGHDHDDNEHDHANHTVRVARGVRRGYFVANSSAVIPASVDWRALGYVNPIQNQGQCGSCYTFSSTAALEGQYFKASGTLVKLSEQNMVDCSQNYGNDGCDGGFTSAVFKYVQNNGAATEASYPYKGVDGTCRASQAQKVNGLSVTGVVYIQQDSEAALTQALAAVGPISVAIDASQRSFQLYKSGVYFDSSCSPDNIDHAVLAVGYGTLSGQDYYIVRNSWGTSWGNRGYVYIARNRNNFNGISSQANYPLVSSVQG